MKKVDANHKMIVEGLRAVGAGVQSIATIGKGVPDLLVAFRGRWYIAEVKDGNKSPSHRALTAAERKWHDEFMWKAPVHVWESLDEALKAIGASLKP